MAVIKVTTKAELKRAVDAGREEIIIYGDLAKKVSQAYRVKKYSKVAIGALSAALAGIVATGPIGMAAAVPIAAVTGMEAAVILAVAMLGFALVMTLTKDYDLIVDIGTDANGNLYVRLNKAKSNPAT